MAREGKGSRGIKESKGIEKEGIRAQEVNVSSGREGRGHRR
jgi:hypothetical protein